MVFLANTEFIILVVLSHGEKRAPAIRQGITDLVGGSLKASRAAVHVLLGRMVAKGLLARRDDGSGLGLYSVFYKITPEGENALIGYSRLLIHTGGRVKIYTQQMLKPSRKS